MSVMLRTDEGQETVGVQPLTGVDGQGLPAYGTSADVLARIMREVKVVRVARGEEVETVAELFIDGERSPLPEHGDRLTLVDGLVGIVVMRSEVPNLRSGELDHVVVQIRKE